MVLPLELKVSMDSQSSSEPFVIFSDEFLLPKPTDMPLPGSRTVVVKRLALNGDRFPLDQENLSIVRAAVNMANGMTIDLAGQLLICERGTHTEYARISRLNLQIMQIETIVEQSMQSGSLTNI